MAEMEADNMATEMTPQERATAFAEQIVKALDVHPSPINIDAVLPWVKETRRAALLEAANAMQKRYDESYDWSPLIENTIAELKRLAQEG